ncbi:Deacetylase [Candidatus Syntrophocurvum alkaliphilum]|uniref:Deacetylase n=1 Tax=Candidatus Syntrophocurvum alkaliphilum TaxID=2293317 RepID=A0A6I6D918_9FIRM|nr:hypothetical protein [Candidatus Syntrophocurvum alkaliphilum]QGT99355.1 Deacetylase [Candidatus Syntrophocurvum alkaliphilum]
MDFIFSEECLKYKSMGHPESPERLEAAYDFLKDKFNFITPEPVSDEDLHLVHTSRHVKSVKNNDFFDFDSPNYENIYDFATLSAGGAVKAQEIQGFSLTRPPGHHAGKDFLGGFCYFNNIAIAVKKSGLKTLILDIDGHHGNGTEDVFLGDKQVTFISLHRTGIFPGTGHSSKDNIFNYPFRGKCGDEKYLETFEQALDAVSDIKFEQIAVSAGFDGHVNDMLASLGITTEAYQKIGEMISFFNLPTFAVGEGGYVGRDLGPNILSFVNGLKNK